MKSIAAVAILAFAFPTSALACSCVRPPPVPESVANASRVFVGDVVAVERVDALYQRVAFRVTEHFKGSPVETVQLVTAADGAMCGYPFAEGLAYVVYAHGGDDELATGSCSRTTLAMVGSDLEALRAGR